MAWLWRGVLLLLFSAWKALLELRIKTSVGVGYWTYDLRPDRLPPAAFALTAQRETPSNSSQGGGTGRSRQGSRRCTGEHLPLSAEYPSDRYRSLAHDVRLVLLVISADSHQLACKLRAQQGGVREIQAIKNRAGGRRTGRGRTAAVGSESLTSGERTRSLIRSRVGIYGRSLAL
jgi:hypothetical protein